MVYLGPNVNRIPPKDPVEVLTYSFDWTAWLSENEIITDAQITVDTGLTLFSEPTITGGVVTFYLSGGTNGVAYNVSCVIQTNLPDVGKRTFSLQVQNQ